MSTARTIANLVAMANGSPLERLYELKGKLTAFKGTIPRGFNFAALFPALAALAAGYEDGKYVPFVKMAESFGSARQATVSPEILRSQFDDLVTAIEEERSLLAESAQARNLDRSQITSLQSISQEIWPLIAECEELIAASQKPDAFAAALSSIDANGLKQILSIMKKPVKPTV
jgi:hypothetical protein